MKQCVVLLSGGLDSATVLAVARDRGFGCCALSFDYGQRHAAELAAAREIAETMGVEKHFVASRACRRVISWRIRTTVWVRNPRRNRRT